MLPSTIFPTSSVRERAVARRHIGFVQDRPAPARAQRSRRSCSCTACSADRAPAAWIRYFEAVHWPLSRRVDVKIHHLVDGAGRPLVVLVSAGQAHDSAVFEHLMAHLRVERVGRGRRAPDLNECAAATRHTPAVRFASSCVAARSPQCCPNPAIRSHTAKGAVHAEAGAGSSTLRLSRRHANARPVNRLGAESPSPLEAIRSFAPRLCSSTGQRTDDGQGPVHDPARRRLCRRRGIECGRVRRRRRDRTRWFRHRLPVHSDRPGPHGGGEGAHRGTRREPGAVPAGAASDGPADRAPEHRQRAAGRGRPKAVTRTW